MATIQRSPAAQTYTAPPVLKHEIVRPLEYKDNRPRFRGCSKHTDYEFLSKLGEGTFGEVHKARSRKTGAIVAVKKILILNERDGFPITSLREIKILKILSHPNILKLEEMAVERPRQQKGESRRKSTVYMITPYMDHDLSGLLENPAAMLSEPQIKCYMLQLLEGVRYLHANKILHRDMKAANLLINNQGILQIADFGLARHYSEEVPRKGQGNGNARRDYTSVVVTRWYRPPELLLLTRRYTPAIDMWGVGCVFGEMFVRRPILAGNSEANQLNLIFDLMGSPNQDNMPGWDQYPGLPGVSSFKPRPSTLATRFRAQGSGVISLLEELLRLDPARRINAMDALDHPYFKTAPLPARPGDLPQYEASHELDKRRFKDRKPGLPPAPAGGSVGMGANGVNGGDNWSRGAGPHPNGQYRDNNAAHRPAAGPPDSGIDRYRDPSRRHVGPSQLSHDATSRYPPPSRRPAPQESAAASSRHQPSWQTQPRPENGLPPRPPPPIDQGRPFTDAMRDRGGPSFRNHMHPGGLGGGAGGGGMGGMGGPGGTVDTYIPNYGGGSGPRRDDDRRNWDRRSGDWDRRRSRSPGRDRMRERERDPYRR